MYVYVYVYIYIYIYIYIHSVGNAKISNKTFGTISVSSSHEQFNNNVWKWLFFLWMNLFAWNWYDFKQNIRIDVRFRNT